MAPELMQPTATKRKRPSRMKHGPAFEFLIDTATTQHGDARTIIRRQAARSGRRAQLRITDGQEHGRYVGTADTLIRLEREVLVAGPATQPSLSGYETSKAIYNFDITTLDSFINVDLAIHAYRLLQGSVERPLTFLQNASSSSFLACLPSRYGSSPFLDDAVHCVAARAAQMLGYSAPSSVPSVLYSKALRSLSRNIQSGSWSDVYCATRLLVLYESLGCPDINALAFHNGGGIDLLRRRGPPPDSAHFDCMLLKSQGPYVLISEMHKKESSMFEAQEWQDFFGRAACRETNVDARFWWRFFGTNCFLPGILKDVGVLLSEVALGPFEYSSSSLNILNRIEKMYRALDDIHKEYQHFYVTEPQSSLCDLPISGRVESADRTRLRHFLQYPTMLICRLRATLSLSEADRAMGEEEAQRFAARTLLIEKMARAVDPVMAWQLAQRNNLPYSIVRTREDWLSINERGENWEELKTFLKQRWLKWEYYWEDEILIKELGQVPIEE